LPKRVRVPSCSCARLEGDAGTTYTGRVGSIEERIDPDESGEPILRAFG
jgi:hypothetical protein